MITYYITETKEGFAVFREGQPTEYSAYLGTNQTREMAEEVVAGYINWQGGKLHEH